MESNKASATALMMCAFRARASERTNPQMMDPWARALAGEEGEAIAQSLDDVFPHMELWTIVRTRFIDDNVARYTSVPWSFNQVIMLGAGLDTRAARLAKEGVRFFEVDHPNTQAEKRRRLAKLDGYPIEKTTFVECNFEQDSLIDRLGSSGVNRNAPALIIWEGVVPYLREDAIRATLRAITSHLHPRSVLVFDHLLKRQGDPATIEARKAPAQSFVSTLGEPVLFGTNDPLPMLYEEGFRYVRSISFDEACLNLTGTYDRARQFRFQRMVVASASHDIPGT
jgi:methyltransferase (TIGR00027 family)